MVILLIKSGEGTECHNNFMRDLWCWTLNLDKGKRISKLAGIYLTHMKSASKNRKKSVDKQLLNHFY